MTVFSFHVALFGTAYAFTPVSAALSVCVPGTKKLSSTVPGGAPTTEPAGAPKARYANAFCPTGWPLASCSVGPVP